MIDMQEEKLIRLTDVPNLDFIPTRRGGAKLNPSTVWRWAIAGCRGVKLETVCVGSLRCTSKAALLRFFERLSMPTATTETTTPSQKKKAHARACAVLDAAGI